MEAEAVQALEALFDEEMDTLKTKFKDCLGHGN